LAMFAHGHPHIAAEQVVHPLPAPILTPDPKVVIDDLPRREVMR
jgi:hypothetical protein